MMDFGPSFGHQHKVVDRGCTYFPSIFALTVEVLGIAIRHNDQICGVKIGTQEVKAGQFADDLWTVSPHSQQNVNAILEELNSFSKFLGLVINPEKCTVLRIGPHKDNLDVQFYTLKQLYWSPGAIKILGIEVTPHRELLMQLN